MAKFKAIKKGYVCRFHADCAKCPMRNLCVSASSIHSGDRKYLLRLRGYREPTTEAMLKGIENHEEYQKGMRDLAKIPFHILRKEMYSGRELEFAELQLCSPKIGLRGKIDAIKIQYDKENKEMNILATELKSTFWKEYLKQLAIYGIILSDLHFRYVEEVTKRKTRRVTNLFYPDHDFNLNIKMSLYVFGQKKPMIIPWMVNNINTDFANGMSAGIMKRIKQLRVLHGLGIEWLEELPDCEHCNKDTCGFYDRFCSKIPSFGKKPKVKQLYMGKRKLLTKTKPKINISELQGMVKIK